MRIAAIDVGTNTALLLVAEVQEDGTIHPVHEAERFVRLGEGVDATGRVGEAAMRRLREALLAYRAVAQEYGVERIVVGATSASRDARNQAALIAFVHRETGLPYDVLTGEEEATWSFLGALSAFDDLDGPCAVIDIGGGSTEIAVGDAAGGLRRRNSLNVGSVRLTERYFSAIPPRPAEVERADAFIRRQLGEARIVLDDTLPFIGASETPLFLKLVDGGVSSWEELDGPVVVLPSDVVRLWRTRLLALTPDEILVLNPTILHGRADVFAAAVLLLDTILRHFGLSECRISPRSLRHGLALRLVQQARTSGQAFEP